MRIFNRVMAWLIATCVGLAPHAPTVPVTIRFNEHQGAKRRWGKAIAGGQSIAGSALAYIRAALGLLTPARVITFALVVGVFLATQDTGTTLLANALVVTLDSKRADLQRLLDGMESVQKAHEGKIMA